MSDPKTQDRSKSVNANSSASAGSAVFESEWLMAITSPCGHTVPIERAIDGPDRYCCPMCGLRYRVKQDPPKVYPSGFIMPGDRHIVIDPQSNLPLQETKV